MLRCLFLGNDIAGSRCTQEILKAFPYAKDFSHLYSDYKDLNQYLTAKRNHTYSTGKTTEKTVAKNRNAQKQDDSTKETNKVTGACAEGCSAAFY